ncbi:O-methyltransferase [Numidum massiliense]|uniref:O-methyltransferase n=1 Tax=Numidum massiliense TaxID=1522315 RepID=UPI0006D55FC4|nr:O-methyltransferase [Numidum massiliense]
MEPEQYVAQLVGQDDPILARVRERMAAANMPMISVAPEWGTLLTMLVRMVRAQRVLEIGALGGYSGICLARGLVPSGKLVSLEIEQRYADIARDSLAEAGFAHLVEYRIGHARDSLAQLAREGVLFDLIFIDADKENYPHYLEGAIALSHAGSVIVADNTMLGGRVYDSTDVSSAALAMRKFNEMIVHDGRLEGIVVPHRDGLAIACVK